MRIVKETTLRDFARRNAQAKKPIEAFVRTVRPALWERPEDIAKSFPTASFLRDSRVVFRLGGNKYRLIAEIDYRLSLLRIRFLGTHAEYDKIDAEKI